jgi:hypothetical protein
MYAVSNQINGILFYNYLDEQAKVACGILVDTVNQTISRQSCSPL